MDLQYVKIEKLGHIYHIRLNRPERLNAIGTQIRHDLGQAWYEFENAPEMRIAVVSGEGRIFSAGRDIREQAERGGSTQGGEVSNPDAPVSKMGFYGTPDTNKPIITAVQGGAWGAGFYIVCGSDICVAAEGDTVNLIAPNAALLYALDEASESRRIGETVLLSLIVLGPGGPGDSHAFALSAALTALARVGLEAEARGLAIEAALANGI